MTATPDPAFNTDLFVLPPVSLGDGASPFNREGEHRSLHGGDQWCFKFPNGYGASVVRHSFSYGADEGLWELAVLGRDGRLAYETPITDDVIGRLTEPEVTGLLDDIEALP